MNGRNGRTFDRINQEQAQFMEEQLFQAKHALFASKTVREMKFLQSKINYLKQQMKNIK